MEKSGRYSELVTSGKILLQSFFLTLSKSKKAWLLLCHILVFLFHPSLAFLPLNYGTFIKSGLAKYFQYISLKSTLKICTFYVREVAFRWYRKGNINIFGNIIYTNTPVNFKRWVIKCSRKFSPQEIAFSLIYKILNYLLFYLVTIPVQIKNNFYCLHLFSI